MNTTASQHSIPAGARPAIRIQPVIFWTVTVLVMLGGCATDQIGGPTAPRGADGAGVLTLPSNRSYPVIPDELAYSGSGEYHWPDGRSFKGDFVQGQPQGMGEGHWPNGDHYRGTWQQGLRHGHGELNRADGSRYLGDFHQGQRAGSGVEQSDEGLYRGNWRDDLPNGQGEFFGIDGAAYDGQWRDGRRSGHGSYTDKLGNRYEGDWRDDMPDGFGVMHNQNGSVYEGEWRASQQYGYGEMTTSAGVVYTGTWVDGRRQGFGVATRPDGSSYDGEWADDRRHGHGTETFADGSYHEGIWQSGQPRGTGTRRDRTGIEISGIWNGDYLSTGLMRLPSGREYAGRLLDKRNTEVDAGLLSWLEAQEDDPWASFFLGTAYTDFREPPADPFVATTHFRRAARAGIPDGQFRLALLLLERSPDQALDWLNRAAAAEQAQANTLLGEFYLTGRLVEEDLTRAVAYLQAGSDAGDMTARNNLAWILATTDQTEIRDPGSALALIKPLALMDGSWQHFDTLAATYAALDDFDSASAAMERAMADARITLAPDSAELAAMEERLDAYRAARQATNPEGP